jgi:hypothetical protein
MMHKRIECDDIIIPDDFLEAAVDAYVDMALHMRHATGEPVGNIIPAIAMRSAVAAWLMRGLTRLDTGLPSSPITEGQFSARMEARERDAA